MNKPHHGTYHFLATEAIACAISNALTEETILTSFKLSANLTNLGVFFIDKQFVACLFNTVSKRKLYIGKNYYQSGNNVSNNDFPN